MVQMGASVDSQNSYDDLECLIFPNTSGSQTEIKQDYCSDPCYWDLSTNKLLGFKTYIDEYNQVRSIRPIVDQNDCLTAVIDTSVDTINDMSAYMGETVTQ